MAVIAKYTLFDENGLTLGGGQQFLPEYLDRCDVRAKGFWFLQRGLGDPNAVHVLIDSQGGQILLPITTPLANLRHTTLKEQENGLERRIEDWCREQGIALH